jgi:nitrogen regulatory protein P-II 1
MVFILNKKSKSMKLIKAYIRHRKTEEVFKALVAAGFCCMTFVECEGTGQYSDHEKEHISDKYPFAQAYRVIKVEILVENNDIARVVEIIRKDARTGYSGDGMILVSPVENVYKVRTDDEGFMSI